MAGTLFRYAASGPDGRRRTGVITAPSEAEAAARLTGAGLHPLSLKPGRQSIRARSKLDHRADAMRRLAALVEANAPLDRALRLAGGTESAGALFQDLALGVAGGRSLSDALGDWPGDFSDAESALIASGEATGSLARATDAAATMLERRSAGRRAIASALAYPAFVVIAAILALAVFIGFAQPRFAEVLQATGAEISPTTAWFFWASELMREIGGPLLLAFGVLIIVAVVAAGTTRGKQAVIGVAMGLPLIGPLMKSRAMEAYTGALGAMLAGGAPLPEAARLAARMFPTAHLVEAGERAARQVTEGKTFSAALGAEAPFPESLVAFVEIGEETGALAPLLDRASKQFGEEAEARARRLSAVAAPAATAVLGILIGAGAYLMMTAVLDVYDAAL